MQASTSSSTLVNGSLPGQRGFDWKPEHGEIIEKIAATNAVSTPWDQLKAILMYKIAENLASLPIRPANAPLASRRTSVDSSMLAVPTSPTNRTASDENSQREKDDLQQSVWDTLDSFDSEPPFTIQRVAELASQPGRNYTCAIKYLRALQRTLRVSSGASAYIADTYALSPGPAEISMLGHVSTASSSYTSPMLRSSSASTTPSPLLSPIPWITRASAFEDSDAEESILHLDAGSSSSPHLTAMNGHDSSLAEGGSPSLPAMSPTGGRVDELDPLPPSQASPQASGMTDHPEPISDPQGSPPRNSKSPDLASSPPHGPTTRRPSA